jgi:hypothetical protein
MNASNVKKKVIKRMIPVGSVYFLNASLIPVMQFCEGGPLLVMSLKK